MRLMPGTCRWCACTEEAACPGGCVWADTRPAATLCSACVPIDVAWKDEPTRPPNMRLAFFRGFLHGATDARKQGDGSNPYARVAAQHGFWRRGQEAAAGAIAGR